jgi:hypothetical protein
MVWVLAKMYFMLLVCSTITIMYTTADNKIIYKKRELTIRSMDPTNITTPTTTKTTMTTDSLSRSITSITEETKRTTLLCRLFRIGCPKEKENDSNGCCIVTSKNKKLVLDDAGNRYGKFEGMLIEQINRTIISEPYKAITYYKKSGITSSYPDAFCGNTIPVQPTIVEKGLLQWNESIDFGACDPASVTLTQSSNGNKTWINTYQFPKPYPYGTGSMKWSCLSCSKLKQ